MTVLFIALGLVALGWLLRLPGRGIAGLLAVEWVAVLLAHLLLPADHPLPVALGGSWQGWLVLGAAGVAGFRLSPSAWHPAPTGGAGRANPIRHLHPDRT